MSNVSSLIFNYSLSTKHVNNKWLKLEVVTVYISNISPLKVIQYNIYTKTFDKTYLFIAYVTEIENKPAIKTIHHCAAFH